MSETLGVSEVFASLLADGATRALLAVLNAGGEEARIVGGAVRNVLIGVPVCDIDITTTTLPEETTRRAKAAGWRVIPTGIDHGTVTVLIEGRPFEVTTLREDIATNGRHAEVKFGRDFKVDAARRDFTMNALSLGLDGVLHDEFGGVEDIAVRRVRFIGDADQRLREDYLRGLRFLRFSAEYGDGLLDAAGWAAVLRHREGFAQLSRERVRQEMLKLLVAVSALTVIDEAESEGILSGILGFPLDIHCFAQALGFARNENVELGAIARLAALAETHAGDAAEAWQTRLRLSNLEISLLHQFDAAMRVEKASSRLLRYRFGDEAIPALILRAAAIIDPLYELPARLAEARMPAPEFKLSGADIIARGVPAGPKVGKILRETEARWIKTGFPAAPDEQHAILLSVLARLD